MELRAYSVRDNKIGVYNPPICQTNDGEAQRTFTDMAKNPQNALHRYPEDFQVFHVGSWDDQTGAFTALKTPRHVIDIAQLIPKVQ